MLRVKSIPGEPTRFFVESFEVQCSNPDCSKLYPRTPAGHTKFTDAQMATLRAVGVWPKVKKYLERLVKEGDPRNVAGGQCRRCGGALSSREHLVDLAGMDAAG